MYKVLKRAPKQVQANYIAWKRIVELQGPMGLRVVKGFHDEVLRGDWEGFRSSRLDLKWRAIYKIEKKQLVVYVIEVSSHVY